VQVYHVTTEVIGRVSDDNISLSVNEADHARSRALRQRHSLDPF